MDTALAFSGGKDSWACLWLNEYRLDKILVIWVNTGKNYPELLEQIKLAQSLCPNFVEVKTDRDSQNEKEGLPSDVVPIDWTSFGQEMTGKKEVKIQSYLGCCYENLSKHINETVKTYGIKRLITGQRVNAVSYTHLDVYKRQGIDSATISISDVLDDDEPEVLVSRGKKG